MTRTIGLLAAVLVAAWTVGTGAAATHKGPLIVLDTDAGQLNDHGFNQLAYAGLQRAQKQLGIDGQVYQAASSQDYIPNLARAAQAGAKLVISVGFDQAAAIATVAKQFPKTHFAIIDVDQTTLTGQPKNVEGLIFREQQVGYLAGYLAGLLERHRGSHATIGSVGGEKQPPVDRYIAGYQTGARAADPKVKLLNAYSQDWVDQAKCKIAALNQIEQGADVVFQVAGGCGLGVLDAAKEKHVWGIGVDADQSYLGSQVLTSAMKRVDTSVFATVKQALGGRFHGGNSVFQLSNGGVGLGKISPKVSKADVAKVRAIANLIAEGKLGPIPTTVP